MALSSSSSQRLCCTISSSSSCTPLLATMKAWLLAEFSDRLASARVQYSMKDDLARSSWMLQM